MNAPAVTMRTQNDGLGRPTSTAVVVSVPVNAVLDRKGALAMINAFRRALVAAAGETKIASKTVKARGGGRTPIRVSGYTHMGAFHVDGLWLWLSLSVES